MIVTESMPVFGVLETYEILLLPAPAASVSEMKWPLDATRIQTVASSDIPPLQIDALRLFHLWIPLKYLEHVINFQ